MMKGPFDRPSTTRVAVVLLTALAGWACGEDLGPLTEEPIDGTWALEGRFQYDVEGTVQCRWSGTLELQQLPGGVNTVTGTGSYSFDCLVPEQPGVPMVQGDLENSRLTGTALSLHVGECQLGAEYDRRRPNELSNGRGFCRLTFSATGVIDVAGAWRAYREEEGA